MRRFAVLVVLAACAPAAPPPVDSHSPPTPSASVTAMPSASTPSGPDPRALDAAAYADLSSRFVKGYLQRSPVAATNAGLHDYDAKWPDVSAEGDAEFLAFVAATRKDLSGITRSRLTEQDQIDASILSTQ